MEELILNLYKNLVSCEKDNFYHMVLELYLEKDNLENFSLIEEYLEQKTGLSIEIEDKEDMINKLVLFNLDKIYFNDPCVSLKVNKFIKKNYLIGVNNDISMLFLENDSFLSMNDNGRLSDEDLKDFYIDDVYKEELYSWIKTYELLRDCSCLEKEVSNNKLISLIRKNNRIYDSKNLVLYKDSEDILDNIIVKRKNRL